MPVFDVCTSILEMQVYFIYTNILLDIATVFQQLGQLQSLCFGCVRWS
jgi:hypothetical protein